MDADELTQLEKRKEDGQASIAAVREQRKKWEVKIREAAQKPVG